MAFSSAALPSSLLRLQMSQTATMSKLVAFACCTNEGSRDPLNRSEKPTTATRTRSFAPCTAANARASREESPA